MTTLGRAFTATLQKSPNMGGWTYVVRAQIGKQAGDRVYVHVDERLSPTLRRSTR